MSNRCNQDGNKGLRKDQKKYIPKNQNQSSKQLLNPKPTLSASFRHSLPKSSDSAAVSTAAAPSMSRIQMSVSGDWVSSRVSGGSFVNYLPQDEAVASGLRAEEGALDPVESQRVVDLLNRELSRLLKLSAKEFWTEVARDTSLHEFLDSFLKFRSRWYDFPHRGANGIVAGVIIGEFELCRRVFMVLYRVSSNRDSGARAADSLSIKDHGVLLQGKKLLDLPKLLDICAIYNHENEDLTRILVENAIKSQLSIHENLPSVISHFLSIVSMMHQRCNSSLETLISTSSHEHSKLQADFLEVIDFINDAIVTLDSFVAAYRLAAIFFSSAVEVSCGNEDLLGTLARLHDILLPSLQQGWIYVDDEQFDHLSTIVMCIPTSNTKDPYKVAGSVAVSNSEEASLVTQAQKELIYGLGRGGNLPLGAVRKLTESEQDSPPDVSAVDPRDNGRKSWGRGRREGGNGTAPSVPEEQGKQPNVAEVSDRGGWGGNRGRGRRGGGNHHRKDRAMNKHFAGLQGF
ncbi:Activating signal cointegrator 1 complex subunit 2, partial [Cucurbita argyrosperma subsp. sororia]